MDVSPTNPTQTVFYNAATPGSTPSTNDGSGSYDDLTKALWNTVRSKLQETQAEVVSRNEKIIENDGYVYGDRLLTALDIPIGHDFTPVNWLKRVIEIHKTQFMGRPFQLISTYDVKDLNTAQDDQDKQRLQVENAKQKSIAELRMETVKNIIRDNGGHALFLEGADTAAVTGSWVIKTWYDEDEKKFIISPVETVENCYAVWSQNDFRQVDLFGYVYQISKLQAISDYGCDEKIPTSPVGVPLAVVGSQTPMSTIESQPMVTVIEATGKVDGWCSKNGVVSKCNRGDETEMNLLFIGNKLYKIIDQKKRLPRYYIFPNKKARKRAWGLSDITHGAIMLNLAYIEALSDWRTVAAKVNFPKFKLFNFGVGTQIPKFKSRQIQAIPLGEGQDIGNLPMGDSGAVDFRAQLAEIKEQFARETATASILLDNDGQSNSNQALITSMKPTTDVAENKKELWSPILAQMFTDAMETLAAYDPQTYGDLADDSDPWNFRVQWPSTVQKEDPIYQQMLMNRWNGGTLSLQSFLEAQGESSEEIDRIRDEMTDMTTAAIHGRLLGMLFNLKFLPPPSTAPPKVNVNLRGDLDPYQVGNLTYEHGFNGDNTNASQTPGGPFPTSAGPTGYPGMQANDNQDNQGFISGQYPNQMPVQQGPNGKPIATPSNNQPGTQPVSQPGSGAPGTTPQGALNQVAQNSGK